MTQDYYGTKRVTAWPAENPQGEQGYAVEYEGGYVSWSPAAVFEAAYQPIDAMSFGHALAAMKAGHKVARAGWNGKGMWIALTQPFPIKVASDNFWSVHGKEHALSQDGWATVVPAIMMKTATGEILMGWLASQTDMLADDWMIVA